MNEMDEPPSKLPSPLQAVSAVISQVGAEPKLGSHRQVVITHLQSLTTALASPRAASELVQTDSTYTLATEVLSGLLFDGDEAEAQFGLKLVAAVGAALQQLVCRCRSPVEREIASSFNSTQPEGNLCAMIGGKREWREGQAEVGIRWERVQVKLWETLGVTNYSKLNSL